MAEKDLSQLELDLNKYIINSAQLSILKGRDLANRIIYDSAKYSSGRTLRSEEILTSNEKNKSIITLKFNPINMSTNTSYAQAMDKGHRLVYFGKKTNRYIEGKHFAKPTQDLVSSEFKANLNALLR